MAEIHPLLVNASLPHPPPALVGFIFASILVLITSIWVLVWSPFRALTKITINIVIAITYFATSIALIPYVAVIKLGEAVIPVNQTIDNTTVTIEYTVPVYGVTQLADMIPPIAYAFTIVIMALTLVYGIYAVFLGPRRW